MINKLKGKGLKCNIEKSLFGQTKMEYLGFWVTQDGVKHINIKIKSITNMAPHTSQKGVRNYYRSIWPRKSHMLTPLNKLTSINTKFK